ncbi:MAG: dynamin family protein [Paracoccaceae bacterium]
MINDSEMAPELVAVPKPRVVLMGEFSSGKSTLSNILLGGPTLPTQVTATRLPPVYITYGEPSAYALARDGACFEVDLTDLNKLSPDEIQSLHITMKSDTLELCDLIDMPGISDPNMPMDTWDAIVGSSDHVIWCTHATQAWRQSEAAMWDRMRDATSGRNLLLITQFDKLRNPRDRSRVLARVIAETKGVFTAVYPVALLDALKADDDFDAWKASGANEFMEHLVEILLEATTPSDTAETALTSATDPQTEVDQDQTFATEQPVFGKANISYDHLSSHQHSAIKVIPRRVLAKSNGDTPPRPPRQTRADTSASLLEPWGG